MAYKKANCRVQMDEREVRKSLQAIVPPGDLFEIRMLDDGWTASGYFTDIEIAIQALKEVMVTEGASVYITLNHIKSGCYGRKQHDKFIENAKPTTSDKDIDHYQYLLLDFDPNRVKGVSATDEELASAAVVAAAVIGFLREQGWPEPLKGKSGNGYHALYWIEHLPASDKKDDPNTVLIQKVLETLNQLFGTNDCEVDCVNFNPARICKLYGTVARKGANTPDRPHRLSKLIMIPEDISQVTREQLEAVAARWTDPKGVAKTETVKTKSGELKVHTVDNGNNYGIENIETWMDFHEIDHSAATDYDGGKMYILDHCVFDPAHTNGDAKIFVSANGVYGYKCHHNSCKDYHFKDVVQKIDPERYKHQSVAAPASSESTSSSPDDILAHFKPLSDDSDKPLPEKRYIFKPYFPLGTYSIFSADPGTGKTKAADAIAALVTKGAELCGVQCEAPGNVLIFSMEDDRDDHLATIEHCGGNMSKVFLPGCTDEDLDYFAKNKLTFASPEVEVLISHYRPALVIFDPYQKYVGSKTDTDKANKLSEALAPLAILSRKYDCHIMIIAHNIKAQTIKMQHKFMGSVDFIGEARSGMMVVRDPNLPEENVIIHIKTNNKRGKSIRYRIESIPGNEDYATVRWLGLEDYSEHDYTLANKSALQAKTRELTEISDDDPTIKMILHIMGKNPGREKIRIGLYDFGECYRKFNDRELRLNVSKDIKRISEYLEQNHGLLVEYKSALQLSGFKFMKGDYLPTSESSRCVEIVRSTTHRINSEQIDTLAE